MSDEAGKVAEPNHALEDAWRHGSKEESLGASGVILVVLGLQVFLALWWWVFGPPRPGQPTDLLDPHLLRPLGFLSACVAALLITQGERYNERLRRGRRWRRAVAWAVTLSGYAYLLTALGTWFALMLTAEPSRMLCRAAAGTVLLGAALSLPSAVSRRRLRHDVNGYHVPAALAHPLAEATGPECSDPPTTLAFSGGGIRAATFALGAWNALALRGPELVCQSVASSHRHDDECNRRAPRLVAVSGGSYLAAAVSLVRRWTATPRGPVHRWTTTPPAPIRRADDKLLPWTEAYAVTSPEAQRLRRHSRDLVEPRSQLLAGVLTLVTGSVINVVVLLSFGWFIAWLLAWLHTAAGFLTTTGEGASCRTDTTTCMPPSRTLRLTLPKLLGPDGLADWRWWLCWGICLVALAVAAALCGLHLWSLRRADKTGATSHRLQTWARWRTPAFGLAFAYLAVSAGVPSLLFSLNQLAVRNAPTTAVASVLETLGFADKSFCRAGAESSIRDAYESVDARARLNLGVAQTAEAGSCGTTYTITATYEDVGADPVAADQLDSLVDDLVTRTAPRPGVDIAAGATAGLTVVTTLVLAVRRANAAADPTALSGWRGRVRKLFTSWLPFIVLTATMTWLLLSWTFSLFLSGADPGGAVGPALWVSLGLLTALGLNANLTALHSYYRQRLSSAFAVARTSSGHAQKLPDDREYRFSELGDVPVHVVTTANVHAYDEVPSRRGGLPMVFGPEGVCLVTTADEVAVPMCDFEKTAGPGRVSVMAMVATSGAAISPMAGRFSYSLAPFRVLLTLFNVRVGTWVPNPLWGNRPADSASSSGGWPRPWLIARPGAAQVFAEAIGRSSTRDRWLYLSDGGHLDNTGLVEAVRLHRTRHGYRGRIVVVDASNDPTGTWSAVGDALGVVRAEMGLDLPCVLGEVAGSPTQDDASQPDRGFLRRIADARDVIGGARPERPEEQPGPFMRVYESDPDEHGGTLEVLVVKAVRPAPDAPELPESVRSFALRTPEFPRASTVRQDFGDIEFEAYRALGEHYTALAWDRWTDHRRENGRPC